MRCAKTPLDWSNTVFSILGLLKPPEHPEATSCTCTAVQARLRCRVVLTWNCNEPSNVTSAVFDENPKSPRRDSGTVSCAAGR